MGTVGDYLRSFHTHEVRGSSPLAPTTQTPYYSRFEGAPELGVSAGELSITTELQREDSTRAVTIDLYDRPHVRLARQVAVDLLAERHQELNDQQPRRMLHGCSMEITRCHLDRISILR